MRSNSVKLGQFLNIPLVGTWYVRGNDLVDLGLVSISVFAIANFQGDSGSGGCARENASNQENLKLDSKEGKRTDRERFVAFSKSMTKIHDYHFHLIINILQNSEGMKIFENV